ncbi:MAG: hypothetical protein IKG93_05340 [Clostridiales bacterium]|nr:hypothetical protein [Clostridiales bacterium]
MALDNRKKEVLQAIVDDYVATCEPVGSKALIDRHDFMVSSATLRNDMAELERMGYLEQPHTSAGRIPSDKGYREYVNKFAFIKVLINSSINSSKDFALALSCSIIIPSAFI